MKSAHEKNHNRIHDQEKEPFFLLFICERDSVTRIGYRSGVDIFRGVQILGALLSKLLF